MSAAMQDADGPKNYTEETYKRAWRLADAAGEAGAHRRGLMRRTGLPYAQYRRAQECAVAEGWVVVRGKGPSARVVDVRSEDLRNSRPDLGGLL